MAHIWLWIEVLKYWLWPSWWELFKVPTWIRTYNLSNMSLLPKLPKLPYQHPYIHLYIWVAGIFKTFENYVEILKKIGDINESVKRFMEKAEEVHSRQLLQKITFKHWSQCRKQIFGFCSYTLHSLWLVKRSQIMTWSIQSEIFI